MQLIEDKLLVLQATQVYEEVREDRGSKSPTVEVSPVYSYASYVKPDTAENTDVYSLATFPQNTVSQSLELFYLSR